MKAEDQLLFLIKYQTGLFTPLAGILIARGVTERAELAAALSLIAQQETDVSLRAFYWSVIDTLDDQKTLPVGVALN
jgi:hypothetical protein